VALVVAPVVGAAVMAVAARFERPRTSADA
jgi:hypothetical protein